MDAKVVWKKRMSFEGSSDSGFTVPLGTTRMWAVMTMVFDLWNYWLLDWQAAQPWT
jgi:hypothetical protein